MNKYKFNPNDLHIYSDWEKGNNYVLFLPKGFRFNDELTHTRSFDTMTSLRIACEDEVISCDCKDCK